IG
ncbi:hypothetical protein AB1N83_013131, partial [Pleurotus pulmonarius]